MSHILKANVSGAGNCFNRQQHRHGNTLSSPGPQRQCSDVDAPEISVFPLRTMLTKVLTSLQREMFLMVFL